MDLFPARSRALLAPSGFFVAQYKIIADIAYSEIIRIIILFHFVAITLYKPMKSDIHPKYYPATKVVCGCGNTFTVGSTKPELHVDICSNCHPFYTGEEKLIDIAGRVEKFKSRRAKAVTEVKPKKVRVKKAA